MSTSTPASTISPASILFKVIDIDNILFASRDVPGLGR
jgi:hypothetical protein